MNRLKCLRGPLDPKPLTGWKPDAVRGSRQARGYGVEWERLRIQALERDAYLCQPCRRNGRETLATAVDHVVPKSQGGGDNLANLQGICDPCHKVKTAAESRGETPGGEGKR